MCTTCRERVAGRSGECHACREYRRRTGRQRPERLVLRHLARRARGGHLKAVQVGATIRLTGAPSPEALCAICGDVSSWVRGEAIPLCSIHAGFARLAAKLLEPDEIADLLTA